MSIFNNKKAQATMMDNYTYAIASFFIIVVLGYLVIEYAVIGNLMPVLIQAVTGSSIDATTQSTILMNYGIIKGFLRILPFAIWLCIVIWLFVINARTENQDI